MNFMMEMLGHFDDEVEGVAEYSKCSTAHKDDPELKRMFQEMAMAEFDHAKKLQGQITKLADEEIDPEKAVEELEAIRNYVKDSMADKLTKAKACLDMAK